MRLLLPLYRFWTASKVQYQPLDGGHGLRRRLYDYRLLFALLVSAGLGAFICYLVVAYLCGPLTLTPYRNPLGVYENMCVCWLLSFGDKLSYSHPKKSISRV